MRALASVAVLGVVVLDAALALRVVPGSPCDQNCGNVLDNTVSSDMTCNEKAYASTSNGIVFGNCVHCELTSPFVASGQTDQQWLLCE
jgi:hypothetical protein